MIYGIVNYKRLTEPMQVLVWAFGVSLLTELMGQGALQFQQNNTAIYGIYNSGRALFMAFFFLKLTYSHRIKWLFVGLAVIAAAECILRWGIFASVSAGLINMAITFVCLYLFMEMIFDRVDVQHYWPIGVMLFVHLAGFMYLSFLGFITDYKLLYQMASVWAIVNLMCNLAYTFALWMSLRYSTLYR